VYLSRLPVTFVYVYLLSFKAAISAQALLSCSLLVFFTFTCVLHYYSTTTTTPTYTVITRILMLCQVNAPTLMPFSKEDKILKSV